MASGWRGHRGAAVLTPPAAAGLRGLTPKQLETYFLERGEPRFRADQVFRRLHHFKARSADEMTELPLALRAELGEEEAFAGLEVADRAMDGGGTEKFVLDVAGPGGPRQVEAVWIVADGVAESPSEGRRTVCISCQSGCSLDCTFCATGTLPFKGNLDAAEMVDQVYLLERARNERATNVVFMGMGEPLHNYGAVIAAARLLNHPEGAAIGARRITISTAGVVPGVERFTEERQPFNLAISLNDSDPQQRASIMPVDRRYPLASLLIAARRYTEALGRTVTFEYVMIAGINMSPRHLDQLVGIARSMRSKINLIPLNTSMPGMRRPAPAEADAFRTQLVQRGVRAFNRGSPGRDVGGACGMLALGRSLS